MTTATQQWISSATQARQGRGRLFPESLFKRVSLEEKGNAKSSSSDK
jgi:hypothetical protein